jgi:curved DNA-binding protein CbpA
MKNRRNYYRILQVQPDAPVEIIRASYHTLMRELRKHPDLGGSTSHASLLNEAYETLSNPARRAAYDDKVLARCIKREAAAPKPEPAPPVPVLCPFCRMRLARNPRQGEMCPTCRIPLPYPKKAHHDGTSRRSISRVKKDDHIAYSSSWPEDPKEAKMTDLSPKGMRFVCSEKLASGTVLKITSPRLRACAVVTYLHQEEGNSSIFYGVGVSFLSVEFQETKGFFVSVSA